jgi:hypothetical protein
LEKWGLKGYGREAERRGCGRVMHIGGEIGKREMRGYSGYMRVSHENTKRAHGWHGWEMKMQPTEHTERHRKGK